MTVPAQPDASGRAARDLPAKTPPPEVREYLDHLSFERGMSPNTVAAYRRDLLAFAVAMEARGRGLSECARDDLDAYFMGPGAAGAPASVARRAAAVRGLYRFLLREGRIAADPTGLVRRPKLGAGLPKVLSIEEVEAVLDAARAGHDHGRRDTAMLELLYGCGLRVSELIGLRVADVDLEAGLVRCIGKGDKERVVPIGGPAAAAVRDYVDGECRQELRGRRRDELFLNAAGRPLTRQGVDYVLRRLARSAGISRPVSAHVFRHSFATHLVRAGADLRSVQEMLGHATIATTQVYTHMNAEHLREVFLETHPRARRRPAR
jgi:integrase/recombinase XerD